MNLSKIIIENFTDVLFVEKISRGIIPPIFNYVSTSKKVFVSSGSEAGKFLDNILERNFDKGQMVKNFSSFIEHKDFKKISPKNMKKVFLKNNETKVIKFFLTETEISEVFKGEGLEKIYKKKISKIAFFTENASEKSSVLPVFNRKDNSEKISILGIINLGLFLENAFLKRSSFEKIKNSFRKEIKKSVLENALLAAHRGEIEIKELLKYLTK